MYVLTRKIKDKIRRNLAKYTSIVNRLQKNIILFDFKILY
jgi:hypothetical protein